MTNEPENMRLTNVFAIRDARGLNLAEKAFLLLVESRGVYTRSAENAYEEMCMSRKLFEKTRNSLEARSLLFVKRFPKAGRNTKPNHYRVNIAEVIKLKPAAEAEQDAKWTTGPTEQDHVLTAHDSVPTAHDSVPTAHESGLRDTTKRINKRTIEDDLGNNQEEAAAPLISQETKEKNSSTSYPSSGFVTNGSVAKAPSPSASPEEHSGFISNEKNDSVPLIDNCSGFVKNNAVGPAEPAPAGAAPAERHHQPAQMPQDVPEMAGGPVGSPEHCTALHTL